MRDKDYLGSVEYSYTLNFSKPAAPVFAQMFKCVLFFPPLLLSVYPSHPSPLPTHPAHHPFPNPY